MHYLIIANSIGGDRPSDAKLSENCLYSHNNNTDLIKQISLFDTALVMKNTKVSIQNTENFTFDQKVGQNRDMAYLAPPPPSSIPDTFKD